MCQSTEQTFGLLARTGFYGMPAACSGKVWLYGFVLYHGATDFPPFRDRAVFTRNDKEYSD